MKLKMAGPKEQSVATGSIHLQIWHHNDAILTFVSNICIPSPTNHIQAHQSTCAFLMSLLSSFALLTQIPHVPQLHSGKTTSTAFLMTMPRTSQTHLHQQTSFTWRRPPSRTTARRSMVIRECEKHRASVAYVASLEGRYWII